MGLSFNGASAEITWQDSQWVYLVVDQGDTVTQQRRGLGKGLGALIPATTSTTSTGEPEAAVAGAAGSRRPEYGPASDLPPGPGGADAEAQPIAGAYFAEVATGSITPNPRQPRTTFDEDALDELASSIREVGLLQPVVVRQVMPGRYELIMGERRWRASQRAELQQIPAIVRETADTDLLRDALMENLHRQQLDPLEEAAAYQQLLDDFGATHEQLARKIGRSRPHISNTLRLLNLPPTVQKRVAAGVLSAGHARALLSLDDAAAQERLAHRIVAEGLSVRAVEEIVAIGDGEKERPRRRVGAKPTAPGLRDLADRLSDALETRVKVELGRRKGKITVEFASLDDLDRIVKAMSHDGASQDGASQDGVSQDNSASQDSATQDGAAQPGPSEAPAASA
jgi:ParB family chromosome partitioning protein